MVTVPSLDRLQAQAIWEISAQRLPIAPRGNMLDWRVSIPHPIPESLMTTRIRGVLAGLILVLGVAAPSVCEDAKTKKTALEGTWKAVEKESAVQQLKFAGDKFEMTMGGKTYKGTFKLNDNENPMHLDMTITDSPEEKRKGKTALGIYEFQGENIRWCSSQPGRKRRPGQFASQMGDALLLLATFAKKK